MAYDIILRRQIRSDISRGVATPLPRDPDEVSFTRGVLVPAAAGLGAAAATMLLFLAATRTGRRAFERSYYRARWRDLASTQETPSVTMRELVYGRKGDE